MAVYQRIFAVEQVADIHLRFRSLLRLVEAVDASRRQAGLPAAGTATRQAVLLLYDEFNKQLDGVAKRSSIDAVARIRKQLLATRVRADTRLSPHLRAMIVARPLKRFGTLGTGEVGVADEAALDRAINPTAPQFGPYWRAQEFGTGSAEVKSQIDRVIRGFFYGPGLRGQEVPRGQYSGGAGPHPIFVSSGSQRAAYGALGFTGGAGARGGLGGYGTIAHEIKGRHFIRDGADAARFAWLAEIARVDLEVSRALLRLGAGSGKP